MTAIHITRGSLRAPGAAPRSSARGGCVIPDERHVIAGSFAGRVSRPMHPSVQTPSKHITGSALMGVIAYVIILAASGFWSAPSRGLRCPGPIR